MDLCAHPTYIAPLQSELAEAETGKIYTIERLPLLDSFLKESARLNGTEWSNLVLFAPVIQHADSISFRPPKGAEAFYLFRWSARASRLMDPDPNR